MENQDSKANSAGRVDRYKKFERKYLPNDFMNNHFNELERERKMVEYFDHANLDIRLFTHCIDIAKLCNSKYESITELNSMNPMRAFTLLSLSDSRIVMEQSVYWNGGSLPKSQERWELLNALDSIEPAKLEELLLCKFKAVKEHNDTITIKIFAGLEYAGFNLQFGESVNKLPVALQWVDFLKEVAEGRIEVAEQSTAIKTETPIPTTPQRKAITFQDGETINAIHKGLKAFFPKHEDDLLILLKGGRVETKLHFPDQQNRLAEVFSRAYYNGKMGGTKTDVQAWIVANFTYLNRRSNEQAPFSADTLRSIFNPTARGEAKKGKRIPIEGLKYIAPESREGYAVK
jgi:hypothetical protein